MVYRHFRSQQTHFLTYRYAASSSGQGTPDPRGLSPDLEPSNPLMRFWKIVFRDTPMLFNIKNQSNVAKQ